MCGDNLFGASLRDYLCGAWSLTRQIDDRRVGAILHFSGTARFKPEAIDTLVYRESGTLDTGNSTMQASQQHHWLFTQGEALVHFADGRPFHRVAVTDALATDQHDCPPDLYHVAYTFKTPDQWCAMWQVSGPRKDYTLQSHYIRLHP